MFFYIYIILSFLISSLLAFKYSWQSTSNELTFSPTAYFQVVFTELSGLSMLLLFQNWVASKLSGVSVVTAKESVQNIPYLSDVSFYEWRKKAMADETDRQQATWWQGTANTDRQQHDDGGQLTQTDSNLGEWISCLDRSTGMHACIILNSSMHVQVHPLFLLPLAARGQ